MKTSRNRHGRKDHSRIGHARSGGPGRRLRLALLGAALVVLGLGTVPAQAGTGGVGASAETAPGKGIAFSSPMRSAGATWYGPGLYGNSTACGQTLRPGTLGVAHRTLPCGTAVKLVYKGRSLVTRVIDRGPYSPGNDFDLTNGVRLSLDFEGVDQIRYAVALRSGEKRD
jgi:hypothetical protein